VVASHGHGNNAAKKPGGVHTITAADKRRGGSLAGREFLERRSRLSGRSLGRTLHVHTASTRTISDRVDHFDDILDLSEWGTNDPGNIQLLCGE
jgi:hypothetical protein